MRSLVRSGSTFSVPFLCFVLILFSLTLLVDSIQVSHFVCNKLHVN